MSSKEQVLNGVTAEIEKEDSNDGKVISTPLEKIQHKTTFTKEENLNDTKDGKSISANIDSTLLTPFIKMSISRSSREYDMSRERRGHCLIFNHSHFDKVTKLNERNGTDRDRDNIKHLFDYLGFKVEVFNNSSLATIKNKLDEYSLGVSHSNCDCFVLFFLSHGEDGHLYARNTLFKVEDLFAPFTADNCPSLGGKPKMFFIQACRGEGLDPGVMVSEDIPRDETDFGGLYKIPSHCDFLISWSTIPGHYSWRNTSNGSWFIQSIFHVFSRMAAQEDVLSMMTEVNRYMSLNFESNCPSNSHMHGMKQSAYLTSTLTRKIYIRPMIKKN